MASSEEVGGLFGVVEAMESVGGIVGPALGGVIAKWGESNGMPNAPLIAVVASYASLALLVAMAWEQTVMARTRKMCALRSKNSAAALEQKEQSSSFISVAAAKT